MMDDEGRIFVVGRSSFVRKRRVTGFECKHTMTRIILVRHGQTAWNREERFRGREDLPLDETGRRQAMAAGQRIAANWSPTAIHCSPLQRAVQTARSIGDACGLSVLPWPDLIDIDYGQWQGLTPAEATKAPQTVQIPCGESLATVRARTFAALQEIICRHPGETVVVVAHTVVNRLLLCAILGLDNSRFWRLRQETAAINVFEWDGQDFTLVSLNDTCHLRCEQGY
jgi:broad specificity phosphatase PhoE